jgi:hypothetical protein
VKASVFLFPECVQAIVHRPACGALTKESRSLVIHRQLSPHLQPSFHVNHLPLHCITPAHERSHAAVVYSYSPRSLYLPT